jgi:histidinol-phosphate aminotransferase
MTIKIPEFISEIKPYAPGKPLDELEREYGISGSIKLASNENPMAPPPNVRAAIEQAIVTLNRYPDGGGYDLTRKLADTLAVDPERIILGNGSDDIIGMLTRALLLPGDQVVMPSPSFLMYEIMARSVGATPVMVPLEAMAIDLSAMQKAVSDKTRLIFLTQPNNPTGTAISEDDFCRFVDGIPPDIVVVVDEAYIEFMRDKKGLNSLTVDVGRCPVVTLRTFSKAYGLAGLRVGYGVMPRELAQILHRVRQPFNVNSLAQAAAAAALEDPAFLIRSVDLVHKGLDYFYEAVGGLGLRYHRSEANFFMIDLERPAEAVFQTLLAKGVIVRSMSSYGYPTCIRVSVGLPDENHRFVRELEHVVADG